MDTDELPVSYTGKIIVYLVYGGIIEHGLCAGTDIILMMAGIDKYSMEIYRLVLLFKSHDRQEWCAMGNAKNGYDDQHGQVNQYMVEYVPWHRNGSGGWCFASRACRMERDRPRDLQTVWSVSTYLKNRKILTKSCTSLSYVP
jgi:hypothetical protein